MRKFVKMQYLIDQSGYRPGATRLVRGWAFQVPGWPEFHACVRFDTVWTSDLFNTWQVDHFETGLKCGGLKILTCKEDAPLVLKERLEKVGKRKIAALLKRHCGDQEP